jgi:PAS domain S-box-containing protein
MKKIIKPDSDKLESSSRKSITRTESDTIKLIRELDRNRFELESLRKELLLAKERTRTERALTEEKLLYSEIRFRRLFESAKDGVLIIDVRHGHIVDVNPYLVNLLGYPYSEFIGKQLWELGFFKNLRDCRKSFFELRSKGYLRIDDMLIRTKEGYEINIDVICNVYLEDREKVIQCNIRDISDRKRSMERLKENEARLSQLNATKDKFFSIIAHDLKGPFTSIIGFSSLLIEEVHNKNYDVVSEYAEIIQASSWRTMDLLTNLLEWSRAQTERMEFNPGHIDFNQLIADVKDLLDYSAWQKTIKIASKVPDNFKVYADKAMLNTILRNLITNAIKFTNHGGNILISATQKELFSVISVVDNGVGIRKEDIERLFRIEESVSYVGTQGEEGTGLGLFLCNEFVRKHGGKIKVESEPGKGSKFTFTLPRTKSDTGES